MSLSYGELSNIGITGRVTSVLSILGSFSIIGTFCCSRYFRSPIHRIIFYNAFYNLFDSVATIISVSGPAAGDDSSLCQFQGFALQMFPLADVLWTLAMALDTYLVVFHYFEAHSLHKLELTYIGGITVVTFIPALTFLFIRSPEKGPIYGSETVWCSVSPHWMLIRLILYYIPVWCVLLSRHFPATFLIPSSFYRIVIAIILVIYCLIGIEISRLREDFKLTSDDHIALTSASTITSTNSFNNGNSTVTTTVKSDPSNNPTHVVDSQIISQSSIEHVSVPRPLTSNFTQPLNTQSPKQRRISIKQYILMPSLFFLALLATWVTPTINRVSAFIRPDYQSYSLLLAVSALGSLRGFWNGIIFITMGMKGWKHRAKERRSINANISQI
ncbi:uncharacterized protein N7498_005236 [Penicillium cinerascens]|uniref:G-protein coupled receptors family 2 profile 2 domain-containing protein n=1 Tax=Penicillium cinerascens TaxID=70096 RepID=A0A9W9MN52_9EURO|nr:uncharacterized protein N7498_005236 [Penicillium cinerascens]KAJ5204357.1 hypothetical protein N7498_005236 [Penicillium cinerascens]